MISKALRLLSMLALSASAPVPARAQYSVYGTVTVERLSSISSSPVLPTLSPAPCATAAAGAICTSYNNSVNPFGFTGGASYDVKKVGPAMLGLDLRGIYQSSKRGAQAGFNGTGAIIYSGLGGVKATFHTPIQLLQPYVEGAVGYGRSNYGVLTNAVYNGTTYPTNTIRPGIPTQNNLEYHVFAGLDLHLLPAVDFRFFELGYGGLKSFGTYSHTYPLYSFSSGVVFHIPPRN